MSEADIRREVWDGKIPVCFSVDQNELGPSQLPLPEPCFMMLGRIGYLPLVYDQLNRLYARAMRASVDDKLWLSHGSVPLKWHYPVGVLYDLYGRGSEGLWQITVHFKEYPEELLQYDGRESLESEFKAKLKEADCLKHRSEVIQGLKSEEFSQLWHGVVQGNFDEFWGVNQKLMLNIRGDPEPFRNIPFCIYQDKKKMFQRLIPANEAGDSDGSSSAGKENTLKDLLQLYYKESETTDGSLQPLIHGIEMSVDIPLQWLSEHLCGPDNFLHVCMVSRT